MPLAAYNFPPAILGTRATHSTVLLQTLSGHIHPSPCLEGEQAAREVTVWYSVRRMYSTASTATPCSADGQYARKSLCMTDIT
jgi:hypothetical protein